MLDFDRVNRERDAKRLQSRSQIVHQRMRLYAGSGNPDLAAAIASELRIPMSLVNIARNPSGEIQAQFANSVRGDDVYLIQSLGEPTSEHIRELEQLASAARDASARTVVAVIPYYAYARQDRKTDGRVSIGAKQLADGLAASGVKNGVVLELHAHQVQGFFPFNVDHILAWPIIVKWIQGLEIGEEQLVIVSPDVEGTGRARKVAEKLGAPLAIIDQRADDKSYVVGVVSGKTAVLVDDMIETARTVCDAAEVLVREGVFGVYAAAAHGLLVGDATARIMAAPLVKVGVGDSVPVPQDKRERCPKLEMFTFKDLIAETLLRIHEDDPISGLIFG